MRIIFLIFLLISLGCQKKYSNKTLVWTAGQDDMPKVREDQKNSVVKIKTKTEVLERFVQRLGDAEIEGSFLQLIKDHHGAPLFLKMSYSEHPENMLLRKVKRMKINEDLFLESLKKRFPEIQSAQIVTPLKIVFSNSKDYPNLFYQLDVVLKEDVSAFRWKVTPQLEVLDKMQVSSYFDGQGLAYPNGPNWSQIEEVLLPDLIGDGTLTNNKISVRTQSNLVAISPNQFFEFKPEDPRFDQVQVFHFAQKMIDLFRSRLGVELPFKLEFQTHLGSPSKKSAMFYFNRSIFLGQGDEVNYKNILKDPTIVMHETAHGFIDALAGLPQGSLNEAFADFFTTSFLNHPHLGEVSYVQGPYTRTVDNTHTVSEKKNTVYGDSLIISGTLWEVRKVIGFEKTESLALKTLIRVGPSGVFDNFGPQFWAVAKADLSDVDLRKVRKILEQRQFLIVDDVK